MVDASNQLMVSDFGGSRIRRNPDNWFNLGDIAEAGGKSRNFASKWLDGAGAEYIAVAQSKMPNGILLKQHGGRVESRGVWAHYKIARRFAQAVSAEVAWHVDEIVEGVVTVAPTAEQSQAALTRAMTAIAERVESLPRIENHVHQLNDRVEKLDYRVARIEKASTDHRQPFSKKAREAAQFCLTEKYLRSGCTVCTCGCERPTDEYEMHHWRGKGGNNPRLMMPLHPDCHKDAETQQKWHDDHEPHFTVWQALLKPYLISNKALAGDTVRPSRHIVRSLFGEMEA